MQKVSVKSLKQLERLAYNLSSCLKGNELILLRGNLGSGKTTFTKFLVSAINRDAGEEVNSPTFSIMNIYETEKFPIYHIDLYRVKEFDVSEIVGKGLIVVEWPDEEIGKIEEVPVIIIKFKVKGEKERDIEIVLKNADYVKECLR